MKGKVLFNTVLTTLNMTTETESGIILQGDKVGKKEGVLMDDQEVVAVGSSVDEIKVGDKVKLDLGKFMREVTKRPVGDFGANGKTQELALPIIEINGEQYARITNRDIVYVYGEDEELKA